MSIEETLTEWVCGTTFASASRDQSDPAIQVDVPDHLIAEPDRARRPVCALAIVGT
jgi:hypothetical protein